MPRLVVPIFTPATFAEFPMGVELAMQRKDQRNVFGDFEIVRRHLDALRAQLLDLLRQMIGIEHDAVADDRQFAGPHDARGQQAPA